MFGSYEDVQVCQCRDGKILRNLTDAQPAPLLHANLWPGSPPGASDIRLAFPWATPWAVTMRAFGTETRGSNGSNGNSSTVPFCS